MARVYLDSCMIIGLIEGDSTQQHLLKEQLVTHLVYSSDLARMETRLMAIRKNDHESLQKYDRFFSACTIVGLVREVFDQATLLRAERHIKTPDALHLAAAIHAGCNEF